MNLSESGGIGCLAGLHDTGERLMARDIDYTVFTAAERFQAVIKEVGVEGVQGRKLHQSRQETRLALGKQTTITVGKDIGGG